jgi:uncharacterized protein (TIGR00369 family)
MAFENPGLMELLGFTVTESGPDRTVIEWDATAAHLQPFGIVHGGVYCAAIESAASFGAWAWLMSSRYAGTAGTVVGVSNQTDFLRAVSTGHFTAVASPIHRGRTQQLWLVEVTSADAAIGLVARGQVRLQNLTKTEGTTKA